MQSHGAPLGYCASYGAQAPTPDPCLRLARVDVAPSAHPLLCVGASLGYREARIPSPLLVDRAVLPRGACAHRARGDLLADAPTGQALEVGVVGLRRDVDRYVPARVAEGVHRVTAVVHDLHLLT